VPLPSIRDQHLPLAGFYSALSDTMPPFQWPVIAPPRTLRRIVGYRRFEGLEAAAALARLYATARLFVNFFQRSFKLSIMGRVARSSPRSRRSRAQPAYNSFSLYRMQLDSR
jgi:hypothetical protein